MNTQVVNKKVELFLVATQFFIEFSEPTHVLFGVDSPLSHLQVLNTAVGRDGCQGGAIALVQSVLVDFNVVSLAGKGLSR